MITTSRSFGQHPEGWSTLASNDFVWYNVSMSYNLLRDGTTKRRLRDKRRAAGLCPRCGSTEPAVYGTHCTSCRAKARKIAKRYNRRWRQAVLDHYGNRCACCGESHPEFLTVDHVNGDGAQERREHPRSGSGNDYHRIATCGYPDTYRLLCWNCNASRGIYKYCPHEP